jgi:outer membrane protein
VVNKQILALIPLALAVCSVAGAQAQTATKVGVIQIQAAIASTKDGQKAIADLQSKMEPRKKDLDKKAADIRDLQDKLQRGGAAMAETAKNELARNIDSKTKSYNRDMEDAQAEADTEQRKMLDDLGQKMMQVIDKYAQSNGYAVIMDVSNPQTPVLYASNTIDITKDIIELYDKSAATLTSTPAAPKPGAAAPAAPKPAPAPPAVKKQ